MGEGVGEGGWEGGWEREGGRANPLQGQPGYPGTAWLRERSRDRLATRADQSKYLKSKFWLALLLRTAHCPWYRSTYRSLTCERTRAQ